LSVTEFAKELTEPINKLLVPIASSAGTTLQDAWELVFGGFGTYVEKKRLSRTKSIEDFKESLVNKVVSIPEDHIQEPPLSIVGPALDASKYYFEEEELREMFANLISATLDDRMNGDIHPSFTEIIKQMSPLDAQNLALINDSAPIVEYRAELKEPPGSYKLALTNVFLEHPSVTDLITQSVSISALVRLGLVTVDYMQWLTEYDYDVFRRTEHFVDLQNKLQKDLPDCSLNYTPGVVVTTPLGNAFKRVCLR